MFQRPNQKAASRLPARARRVLPLLALVPVVVTTVVAGTITAPWNIRPCITNFKDGFTGGPTHVSLGPDGNLWSNEGRDDKIAKFDQKRQRVTAEYAVPKNTGLHDLAVGPDGNLWFAGSSDRFGKLDVKTGKVTLFPGLRGAGDPHVWWARDGFAYISEVAAGRLARFDPKTGKITASRYTLPLRSGIHSFTVLPDGNTWWGLQYVNELARFNIGTHSFDRFVKLRGGNGPHWVTYVPSDHAVWVAFAYSNNLGRYDLQTGKVTYLQTPLKPAAKSLFKSFGLFPYLTTILPDARGRYLWAATLGGGELLRVDLKTHKIKKVYCGLGPIGATIVLVRDRTGRLWVTEPFDRALGRIRT
jgi:streptogramin lyase